MLAGHFSDIHSKLDILRNNKTTPDVWISSGDFFGNAAYLGDKISLEKEIIWQTEWLQKNIQEIADILRGKPIITVDGNHDFISLGKGLADYGLEVYDLDLYKSIDFNGIRVSGFRHINYIYGDWSHEIHDFEDIVDACFAKDPSILVTHSPPSGILDLGHSGKKYGVTKLARSLAYAQHRILYHCFGHIHEQGGKQESHMGIQFSNAATKLNFIEMTF